MSKKLPHWIFPGFWGLSGTTLEKAKIEYYEEPSFERDLKILKLENYSKNTMAEKMIDLYKKHEKPLTNELLYFQEFHFLPEENDELLLLMYEYEDKNNVEYLLKKANILKQPFIGIINSYYDPEKGIDGMRVDYVWNDEWIKTLRSHGYTGANDEVIIDAYLHDMHRDSLDYVLDEYPI